MKSKHPETYTNLKAGHDILSGAKGENRPLAFHGWNDIEIRMAQMQGKIRQREIQDDVTQEIDQQKVKLL